MDILASAIGASTNPTKISNTFKSERGINYSNKTISNHIDYLAEAFLISKADRYDIKGRKYVGANLKYYFTDVGIVDVFAKNSEGKRVHKQLEVDFVVNQGSQRYYIQVAYDMQPVHHDASRSGAREASLTFVLYLNTRFCFSAPVELKRYNCPERAIFKPLTNENVFYGCL